MTAGDMRSLAVTLFKALGSPVHYWMEMAIEETIQWAEQAKRSGEHGR